ncbi:PLAT/LH2 domain-containing protein [Streptomyces sp. NPDC047070]|uniref:PLAT/LH2 domain-containing protein n=1 Tax=Streptomyces sp. NPDC047070 TaxID=3154923 RepID=UPI0034567FBE
MPEYRIQVATGKVDGAGTDANVYLTIYGSVGSSEEIQLESGRDDFERASVSNFIHTMRDLGALQKVRIRHDNSGHWPGWFLERIVIRDEEADKEWSFPCSLWLATDEHDEQIDRILDLA